MVVYKHSAKDAQGLASCRLGHILGPRNTDWANEVLRFSESTHLHLGLISLAEADGIEARTRAKSLSITPTRCATVDKFPALSVL